MLRAEVRAIATAHGWAVGARATADGTLPLYHAARCGHRAVVAELVARGVDVEAAEPSGGYKPLHIAAWGRHVGVINELASAGALVNAKNGAGETALYIAAEYGNGEVVQHLLAAHGADPLVCDNRGWTAEAAAQAQKHTDIAALLSDAAARFRMDRPGGFRPRAK